MKKEQDKNIAFIDAFKLSGQGVVCIYGGGGKTSLMFTLAALLTGSGKTVLTTTTTKIFLPPTRQAPKTLICRSAKEVIMDSVQIQADFPHICAGSSHDPETGKITGFSGQDINTIRQAAVFDWIIVEADGAQRRPIKASAGHEPVFPPECTHLILVAGLDAVGAPLDSIHVHRPEIFSRNTGCPNGTALTESVIARALDAEINKANRLCSAPFHHVFLNKADTDRALVHGNRIAAFLDRSPGIHNIGIGTLLPEPGIKAMSTLSGNI